MLKELEPRIGRIHLIEAEYALAMRKAELAWVHSIGDEIRAGTLTWNYEKLVAEATCLEPAGDRPSAAESDERQ